jgi:Tfp pilus assembly protein PilO
MNIKYIPKPSLYKIIISVLAIMVILLVAWDLSMSHISLENEQELRNEISTLKEDKTKVYDLVGSLTNYLSKENER